MNTINKLLITSLTLLMGACASPNIQQVGDYTLQIQLDENRTIKGYGEIIYKSRVNLTNINIYQDVYQMQDGLILTYEDAVISTGYQFSYGVNRMVDIIFPDYNTKSLKNKGNFYFIELNNYTETVYLILENMNKKRYQLVYGFDKKTFDELFDTIVNSKEIVIESKLKTKNTKKIADPQNYVESGWNQRNIILDVILTKVGGSFHR